MTRTLPNSIEAEQAVLGGIMCAEKAYTQVSDLLTENDFYRRDHAVIWSAIKTLADKQQPFDAVTVGDWLGANGMGELVQDGAYLIDLAGGSWSAANIRAYAEIVKDKATLRDLIAVGTEAQRLGYDTAGRDTSEIIAEVSRKVSTLAGSKQITLARSLREVAGTWVDSLQAMYQAPDTAHGILTPWAELNRLTNGFYDGDLVIAAGRPSMGKSAFAVNFAMSAAMRGLKGMVFALEMTDVSLFNRMVSTLSNVPLAWMRKPSHEAEQDHYWPRISDAVRQLHDAPMIIDPSPALPMDAIVARAKREHMRGALRYVVIDHMHLIPINTKRGNDAAAWAEVSGAGKALAKYLGCPVIMLAQLNRGVESRSNKRPMMSDLRESGAIEQDADTIIFFYRDEYYAKQEGRQTDAPGVLEMIVAKQREGETGTAYACAELDRGRIVDFEHGYTPPQREAKTPVRGFGRKAAA